MGPLSFGSKGVDVKPQLKVGLQAANVNAELGLGDVRDGLKVVAKAEALVEAQSDDNCELYDMCINLIFCWRLRQRAVHALSIFVPRK